MVLALILSKMKRLSVVLTLGLFAFLVIGATGRSSSEKEVKKICNGYTVIEASMGIDCNGDTIQLQKVGGFYERMP